jgi:predicted metal-dependent hydrolase
MSTESETIRIADLEVEVVRKDIKNLHVGVYPPAGRVRVAAPRSMADDPLRVAVASRLPWIRRKRKQIAAQPRQTPREMVDGEAHFVWGRRYRLRLIVDAARRDVERKGDWLLLPVPADADLALRERRLSDWYRSLLKPEVEAAVERWARVLDVPPPTWRVQRMKTKWGSCNTDRRSILVNLELAKKPHECLDFVIVHELVHLRHRRHDDAFFGLMDRTLPDWRTRREILSREPLAAERWDESGGEAAPSRAPRNRLSSS